MKPAIKLAVFAAFMFLPCAFANAQSNVVFFRFTDSQSNPQTNRYATLTGLCALPGYNGNYVAPFPMVQLTDTNGTAYFTNVIPGYEYVLEFDLPYKPFFWTNGFPTNLTGTNNGWQYNGIQAGNFFAYFIYTNLFVNTVDDRGFTNTGSIKLTGAITNGTSFGVSIGGVVTMNTLISDGNNLFSDGSGDLTAASFTGIGSSLTGIYLGNMLTNGLASGIAGQALTLTSGGLLAWSNAGTTVNTNIFVGTNGTAGFTNSGKVLLTGGLYDSTGQYPVASNEATVVALLDLSNAIPAANLVGIVPIAHGGTGNTNGPGSVPCTLWVSATGGNNSTASRGTLLPFQTIRAAVNASQPGDLIYVLPGLYSENNLLTNGVNYYFEAGATDSYMQILTNEYLGIFDDRSCGPTTNIIGGYGAFVFLGCTNFITFGNFGGPAPVPNPALRGAITISNSATQLEFHAASLGAATGMQNNGFCAVASLLGRSDLFITQIYNPYGTTGTITVTNTHGNPPTNQGTTTFSPSCQSAIYWELGNCYYHGDTIEQLGNPNGAGYAIWENEPSAGHTNALFVDLNEIHNKVYIVSYSTEYTSWLNIKRVDCSTNISGESCVDFSVYGAGKHYIVSDKINSGPGGECIELQPQLGVSNSQVWLNAQKLTGGIGWVYNNGGGTLRAQVIDYDDAQGQIVDGFSLNPGGVNYIEGGLGWVSNGIGIFTTGGTNFFDNLALDTSNGGQTNNWPVLLDGGSNYVNGCRFNCPASTYSIMSSNSVTVPLLSSFVHGGASPTVTTTTNY